jgi:hypothetical protein
MSLLNLVEITVIPGCLQRVIAHQGDSRHTSLWSDTVQCVTADANSSIAYNCLHSLLQPW